MCVTADALTRSVGVEYAWRPVLVFALVTLLYPERGGGWPMKTREVVEVMNEDGVGSVPGTSGVLESVQLMLVFQPLVIRGGWP